MPWHRYVQTFGPSVLKHEPTTRPPRRICHAALSLGVPRTVPGKAVYPPSSAIPHHTMKLANEAAWSSRATSDDIFLPTPFGQTKAHFLLPGFARTHQHITLRVLRRLLVRNKLHKPRLCRLIGDPVNLDMHDNPAVAGGIGDGIPLPTASCLSAHARPPTGRGQVVWDFRM